jgi:hypothetical protein
VPSPEGAFPISYTGFPAISIPCGFSSTGAGADSSDAAREGMLVPDVWISGGQWTQMLNADWR